MNKTIKLGLFQIMFEEYLNVNLEFQINKYIQKHNTDEDQYTVIYAFVVVDDGIKIMGSMGIDGESYGGYIFSVGSNFEFTDYDFPNDADVVAKVEKAGYAIPSGWNY